RPNGLLDLQQDRPGIHLLDHAHDRHARALVAADDRPVDRRGAAQLRQERRVHVDRTERRHLQHIALEDLAVGDDDGELRLERRDPLAELLSARLLRLQHEQTLALRDGLDRRRVGRAAPAGGPVRLRDDADHLMTLAQQRAERRDRELGGAPEEDSHGLTPGTAAPSAPLGSASLGSGGPTACLGSAPATRVLGSAPAAPALECGEAPFRFGSRRAAPEPRGEAPEPRASGSEPRPEGPEPSRREAAAEPNEVEPSRGFAAAVPPTLTASPSAISSTASAASTG